MSRSSSSGARPLTLTEELEKLEQSITLTLQEIDHNFSRAHRIVTTSILPIVEQYAKHSEAVWEGSKFWKQFFEASANVSLSGYEEAPAEDTLAQDDTTTHYEGDETPSRADDTATGAQDARQPSKFDDDEDDVEDTALSSPSVAHAHSTPRMPSTSHKPKQPTTATFAQYPSPYETLKREVHGPAEENEDEQESPPPAVQPLNPTTPGKPAALPDMSMTPQSSPFAAANLTPPTQQRRVNNDPLLHRVLDKTYRIAATPHTQRKQQQQRRQRPVAATTPGTANRTAMTSRTNRPGLDSSPLSSPGVAAPQLRADIFSSPLKAPRTPGVSVQTPGVKRRGNTDRDGDGDGEGEGVERRDFTGGGRSVASAGVWDSDSDEEDGAGAGFSPPKTMQFHVPQSRLLQTPAREASKRIVEDLLLTAGGDITDDLEEDSPSVVRRNQELDDSF